VRSADVAEPLAPNLLREAAQVHHNVEVNLGGNVFQSLTIDPQQVVGGSSRRECLAVLVSVHGQLQEVEPLLPENPLVVSLLVQSNPFVPYRFRVPIVDTPDYCDYSKATVGQVNDLIAMVVLLGGTALVLIGLPPPLI